MTLNLIKKYPDLLELNQYDLRDKKESLRRIFDRDIQNNSKFKFENKVIRPIKKNDGVPAMDTLFNHLITKQEEKSNGRSFDLHRSIRLHWIKYHIDKKEEWRLLIFSFKDRIKSKDVIRTYIFDKKEKYVVILEPQRSRFDYYLITAFYFNEKGRDKQILKKYKKRLDAIY